MFSRSSTKTYQRNKASCNSFFKAEAPCRLPYSYGKSMEVELILQNLFKYHVFWESSSLTFLQLQFIVLFLSYNTFKPTFSYPEYNNYFSIITVFGFVTCQPSFLDHVAEVQEARVLTILIVMQLFIPAKDLFSRSSISVLN